MAGDQLDLAIDWGTWKFVVCYMITPNGVKSAPKPLMIGDRSFEVRMMATWIDGRFVHGHELQKEAASRRDLNIVDFFKLPLYRGPETSELTARVEAALAEQPGNKTLDILIMESIQAIVRDAKAALRRSELKIDFRSNPDALEKLIEGLHVRITIPQMWTPDARRRMQSAAKNAGVRVSVLSYEPQCALAYLVHVAAQRRVQVGSLSQGDSILVADLGCGTSDFVHYELQDDLCATSRLQCIGQSSGEICGSFRVDEELLRIFKEALGLDGREFERRTLVAIEEAKLKFGKEDEDFTTANIKGVAGAFRSIQFNRADFYEAFDAVIPRIISEIDKVTWGVRPTVILVSGGFLKGGYLMDKLRARYEPGGSIVIRPSETDTADCFPVAMGALLRYDNISIPPLPSKYGYALLQRQDFDEEKHLDAYEILEDYDETTEMIYKPWVQGDPYDSDYDVVDDRIVNIIRKGQVLQPNQVIRKQIDQNYIVPCDDPRLTDKLVYTTGHIEDNQWAKKETDVEGTYEWRPGVHYWTSVDILIDRSKLDGKGFETITESGKQFYLLRVRMTMRHAEIAVKIGYEILKPKGWNEGCDRGGKGENLPRDVAFRVVETLWEANHSEFVE